jgi:hypothetical protein
MLSVHRHVATDQSKHRHVEPRAKHPRHAYATTLLKSIFLKHLQLTLKKNAKTIGAGAAKTQRTQTTWFVMVLEALVTLVSPRARGTIHELAVLLETDEPDQK